MSVALYSLFYIVIFPGFLFLSVFSMIAEYVDRKFHAKLQNRIGPPWFQPFADFLKLVAKEELIPELADTTMFKYAPIAALTATVAAFIYVPIWSTKAPYFFDGDLIVVLYLLTIPTMTFFIGGWYSRSMYAMLGAVRSVMQLFAYEVPLFLSILAPALLADTWSLSGIADFYSKHPLLCLCNVIGFAISMVAMLGKLEKVPFDIPEAETEIVAGSFTEYSGRLYALFRLTLGIEMLVGCSIIAAVFLPFGMNLGPYAGFAIYIVKIAVLVCIISLLRTVMARLRIDQMINFCWQIAAPLAFFQLVLNLVIKEGFLFKMIKPGKMISEVLANFFEKSATLQYPYVKVPVPDKFRGRIVFVSEKCIGCKACVRDCPAKAIEINKVADKTFDAVIYSDRCIFCAQCVDSCPKDALIATREFELAQIDRKKLTTVFHANPKKEPADKQAPVQSPAPAKA